MANLRLGAAALPLVASARESGDNERIVNLANTGFFFYSLLGIATMIVAMLLIKIPALTEWLPDNVEQDAALILPVAVLVFVLSTLISFASGLLQGLQRYDRPRSRQRRADHDHHRRIHPDSPARKGGRVLSGGLFCFRVASMRKPPRLRS